MSPDQKTRQHRSMDARSVRNQVATFLARQARRAHRRKGFGPSLPEGDA